MNDTNQEPTYVDIDNLWKLHTFLSGYALGKGNLLPLGLDTLENLENGIRALRGEPGFKVNKLKQ